MRKMTLFRLCTGIMMLLTACQATLNDIELPTRSGIVWKSNASAKAKAFFFLGPECPISINYTKTINDLYNDDAFEDTDYAVVIPGVYYSDSLLNAFVETYQLELPIILDREKVLTDLLQASVTPEVVLLDSNNHTMYSGKIDNWAMALGVKKNQVTETYFVDALNAYYNNEEIAIKRTKPVGCFIE